MKLLAHAYFGALFTGENAIALGGTRLQLFVFLHEDPMGKEALTLTSVRGNNQGEQYYGNKGLHRGASYA